MDEEDLPKADDLDSSYDLSADPGPAQTYLQGIIAGSLKRYADEPGTLGVELKEYHHKHTVIEVFGHTFKVFTEPHVSKGVIMGLPEEELNIILDIQRAEAALQDAKERDDHTSYQALKEFLHRLHDQRREIQHRSAS